MVAIILADAEDVRKARVWAGLLAYAAGVADPKMVEQAVAEAGNNCIEHRDSSAPAVLRVGIRRRKLVLHTENDCRRRPTWKTSKPAMIEGFGIGGYGLPLIRAVAQKVRLSWRRGRVVLRAEFV